MTTETQPLPNGVNATAVVDFARQLQADAPPEGTHVPREGAVARRVPQRDPRP